MHMAAKKEETVDMAAKKEEEETVEWSELPYHLLDLIMDCLNNTHSVSGYVDYISFGNVCVSWRSAYNIHNPCLPGVLPLPVLMVPPSFSTLFNPSGSGNNNKKKNKLISTLFNPSGSGNNKKKNRKSNKKKKKNKKEVNVLRFYDIWDESFDDRVEVRMPHNSQCRGSSHGWLITVDNNEPYFSIRLFNPILFLGGGKGKGNGNIILPSPILLPSPKEKELPLESLCLPTYDDFEKAVLSADPISNPTDYMVMAIYSSPRDWESYRELAFYKPGDTSWTGIKSPNIEGIRDGYFVDLIYYQDKFFVINCNGTVVVCDELAGGGMAARVLLQHPIPITENSGMRKYLVESSQGNLLQVHRQVTVDRNKKTISTMGFKIFELFLSHDHQKVHEIGEEEEYEWVEVESLCGDAMFVGHNASFCISTIDNPGYKSNCIYYMDDSDYCMDDLEYGCHDMGVFNLEEGKLNRYFPKAKAKTKTKTKDKDTSSLLILPPTPIWIQPNLQWNGRK